MATTIPTDQTIHIEDVQEALNTSESNVGLLCTHDNVNPWSRAKPIRDHRIELDLFGSSVNTGTGKREYNYMCLDNGIDDGLYVRSCGFAIKTLTGASETIKGLLNMGDTGWKYLRPTGDALLDGTATKIRSRMTPYRLGDFRGYFPSARNPFGSEIAAGSVLPKSGTFSLMMVATLIPATGAADKGIPGQLFADDFGIMVGGTRKSFAEMYFGFVIFDTAGNIKAVKTNTDRFNFDTTITDTSGQGYKTKVDGFDLSNGISDGGTARILPFLSSTQIADMSDLLTVRTFVPLPFMHPLDIKVSSNAADLIGAYASLSASTLEGSQAVDCWVTFVNERTSSVTFNNHNDATGSDGMDLYLFDSSGQQRGYASMPDVVVAAKSSVRKYVGISPSGIQYGTPVRVELHYKVHNGVRNSAGLTASTMIRKPNPGDAGIITPDFGITV